MTPRAGRPTVLMPHNLGTNRFIVELSTRYRAAGWNVLAGRENLQYGFAQADLLHLHWPEEQYRAGLVPGETPETRARMFIERLDAIRASGGRVVWQVHNLYPHEYEHTQLDKAVYQQVIDRAHLLVHHCDASRELLRQRYVIPPGAQDVLLPLGQLFPSYERVPTRDEARGRLGLPADATVFLHFGAIRAYKGLRHLLQAFRRVSVPRKRLVIAGRYEAASANRLSVERLTLAVVRRFGRRIRWDLRMIPEEAIPDYFGAADVVVLSHRWGLNSGVACLAMRFGKITVAPDIGCIAATLRAGDSVVYPPGDDSAMVAAMERAASMDRDRARDRNMSIASAWDAEDVVGVILRRIDCPDATRRTEMS